MNRIYIVTGATKGLGFHLKKKLEKEGCKVISINRSDADFSSPEDLSIFVNRLKRKIDLIEEKEVVFVNNAATLGQVKPLLEISLDEITSSVNTNLVSSIIFSKFLLSLSCPWSLFNISTGAAYSTNMFLGLYSVTKLAAQKYFEFVSLEAKSNFKGIYNYDPGVVKSSMNRHLLENPFFNSSVIRDKKSKDLSTASKDLYQYIQEVLS